LIPYRLRPADRATQHRLVHDGHQLQQRILGEPALAALPCPMPSTALLTSDDLDEIGCSALDLDRPLEAVAELVDAVDQGRVADQADTGYALLLAAEITESTGDVPAAAALACAGRALRPELG
jgi:hypothetical protein